MIDTERLCREFDLLTQAQRDTQLKKIGSGWWAGPCPLCGQGTDRFQIKTKGDITKWYCRGCGLDRYHDAIDYVMRRDNVEFMAACKRLSRSTLDEYEIDPVQLAEHERIRQEKAEADSLERKRRFQEFSDRWVSEEHNSRMAEKNYQWWESQGIGRKAVDWWKLGYMPAKNFIQNDLIFTRPAYTIPKYDLGWQLVNVDYRLVDPPEGVGKYRPEYGLSAAPFLTRPDLTEFPEELFIVEGSKKAMVTSLCRPPDQSPPMVIGVPSKNSWCGISERVKQCGRVWVILDPDAQREAQRLGEMIGKIARVITLPFKIDDGFMRHGFTWNDLKKAMRWAI